MLHASSPELSRRASPSALARRRPSVGCDRRLARVTMPQFKVLVVTRSSAHHHLPGGVTPGVVHGGCVVRASSLHQPTQSRPQCCSVSAGCSEAHALKAQLPPVRSGPVTTGRAVRSGRPADPHGILAAHTRRHSQPPSGTHVYAAGDQRRLSRLVALRSAEQHLQG